MKPIGQEILKHLKAQETLYRAMKQAVERQTVHIETMDIGGLTVGTGEVREMMRKIRDLEAVLRPLRQSWAGLGIDRPASDVRAIEAQIGLLRLLIEEIQALKERNQGMLGRSMEAVRKQMSGLNVQSRAARSYVRAQAQAARFIDRAS